MKQDSDNKSKELYRLIELGQLSTLIFHELTNYVLLLELNIDKVHALHNSSETRMAKQTLAKLHKSLDVIRKQLSEDGNNKFFIVSKVLADVFRQHEATARRCNISISLNITPESNNIRVLGDQTRLHKIITILINNAIDSCGGARGPRQINIHQKLNNNSVEISVIDSGPGIPQEVRRDLFKPYFSTKAYGMGIGLFIARQITKTHFKGSLRYKSSKKFTEFILIIPVFK